MSSCIRFFTINHPIGYPRYQQLIWSLPVRHFASTPAYRRAAGPELPYSDEEFAAAREWASSFKPDSLPREIAKTRFDRSSGKGGQHVNKTNSKATTAWQIKAIAPYVPAMIAKELRASRYYSKNSDSLTIASQEGRVQRDNEDDCHQKLYAHIADIAKQIIPGETTEATKERVAKQKKIANALRLQSKKEHSVKKQSRSNRGPDY